jgi:LmbE family N-acetylglucosaminyl deacetylase
MIINEPTDELIFAGDHLLSDSYLVVCVSCKRSMDTLNFANVIKYTGDDYVLLYMNEYKDDERVLYDEEELIDYLKPIINEKNWKTIVTYNKDGQYGDMNNKQISNVVTNLVEDKTKLYYFGNYYSKNEIRNHYDELVPIKNKNKKLYLLGLYNKEYLFDAYSQMIDYENFVSYEEWGE